MSALDIYNQTMSGMADIFADSFGSPFTVTLESGQVLNVNAVFRPANTVQKIGQYGADQVYNSPRLDLKRHDLTDIGLTDLEDALSLAAVTVNGVNYQLDEIRDDNRVMVKCTLAKV